MALPQRKSYEEEQFPNEGQPQNTYRYEVRNAQKYDRRGLVSDLGTDPRLLSSENPTLREREERTTKKAANESRYYQPAPATPTTQRRVFSFKKKITRAIAPINVAKKFRASAVSIAIVSWGMTLWVIQVIFSLFGILWLGVMGAADSIINSNFITSTVAWLVNQVTQAATWIITGTAITLGDVAAAMFGLAYLFTFGIGMITLMGVNIHYMVSRVSPLSGENLGMKLLALLIAICGYAFPLTSIFPWFLIVVYVVWKYPK